MNRVSALDWPIASSSSGSSHWRNVYGSSWRDEMRMKRRELVYLFIRSGSYWNSAWWCWERERLDSFLFFILFIYSSKNDFCVRTKTFYVDWYFLFNFSVFFMTRRLALFAVSISSFAFASNSANSREKWSAQYSIYGEDTIWNTHHCNLATFLIPSHF